MAAASAYQYNSLPQGAMPRPSAVYDAAPSGMGGANGMPIMAMPTMAANDQRFAYPVDVSALPPEHVQWMQPAQMQGPVGGQMGNVGVQLAGTGLGWAASGETAKNVTTKLTSKVVGSTLSEVANVGIGAGVGGVITTGVEAWSGARDRKEAMIQMVHMYAPVIAEQMEEKLGRPIKQEELNEESLRAVAKDNKVIAEALRAYDDGVTWKPTLGGASAVVGGAATMTLSSGLSAAAGAAGLTAAAGATGFVAVPVFLAIGGVGMAAGFAASSLAEKVFGTVVKPNDISDTIHGKILELRAKVDAGEQLSAKDVFSLHARMNGSIQKRMEENFGIRKFDDLTVEHQAKLMGDYRGEMPLMQQTAYLINSGYIKPEMAAFVPLNAIASTMTPTMMPEAALPMVPPVVQIETSGAQVEYMQPRVQAQGAAAGGYSANVAAQRAQAANADILNQRA